MGFPGYVRFSGLLLAGVVFVPAVQAQRLDPSFPGSGSYVAHTATGYLDLEARDSDFAGVMVPRAQDGGLTMAFLGEQTGDPFTSYQIGLRRMFGNGVAFGANLPTGRATAEPTGIVDGVDAGAGVCLLLQNYSFASTLSTGAMECIDDTGLSISSVSTPDEPQSRAGAIHAVDSAMLIVGSFAPTSVSNTFKLYFERRDAVTGAEIGTRVEHDLSFALPAPVDNRLQVTAMERDAQGRWVVAGQMIRASGAAETEAFLARFNPDFSRDTSFGVQGLVNLGYGGTEVTRYQAQATDLAVLDNGMIVVTGLGCRSVDCGAPNIVQTLSSLHDVDGALLLRRENFVSTGNPPRAIQVEATRAPFVPRDAVAGYITVEQYPDREMLVATYADSNDFTASVDAAFFRLRYTDSGSEVPRYEFADFATTRSGDRTRHYVAWTYLANTGNPTDTDMLMGELQPLAMFADGFE
jgi:hypothetical protein